MRTTGKTLFALVLLAAGSLAALPAAAVPFLQTAEQAIETTSSDVALPASVPSTVLVPGCATRCPGSLAVTAQTQFFLGRKPVTAQALRQYALGKRVGVTLFYDPAKKTLTRVVVDE
jgi:hypothetical protein